jgi:hypothetical protein
MFFLPLAQKHGHLLIIKHNTPHMFIKHVQIKHEYEMTSLKS